MLTLSILRTLPGQQSPPKQLLGAMSVSFPLHGGPPNNGKGLSHVLTLVFLHSELQLLQDDQSDQEPLIGVLGLKHIM